jgi:methylmalonyl-CoA mutase cobalamin-binding subunit
VVVGGSVITPSDRQRLLDWGVTDVFGPDTDSSTIVSRIRALRAPAGSIVGR